MKINFIKVSTVILIISLLLVSAATAFASDSYVTLYGFAFDLNSNGEAVIHGYDDRSDSPSIPGKLIGADVTELDDYAFFGDDIVKSVSFNNAVSLRRIGTNCFYGCTGVSSVTLPASLSSIGSGAFQNCSGLNRIAMDCSVSKIPAQCFLGCSSLSRVVLPGTVTEIADRAFSGCSSLSSVYIPNSVTIISTNAFSGCDDLVIVCSEGSFAQSYAEANSIPFVYAVILGDLNSDGNVNIMDVTYIQKCAIGKYDLPENGLRKGDINLDGKVSVRDATLIQLFLAGIDSSYPIGALGV